MAIPTILASQDPNVLGLGGDEWSLTHWMIGLGPNWMMVTMNGLGPKSLLKVDIPETTT